VRGDPPYRLRLGEQLQEEALVTFQVVEGITENIRSVNRALETGARAHFETNNCYIHPADGKKATFTQEGKQFLLPFEELSESARLKQPKVAVVDPADEEAVAAQEYAMHVDEDTEAVREYAEEEEEEEAAETYVWAEELRREDAGLLADLEQDAEREDPPEGKSLPQHGSPSQDEIETHRLTHLPYQPWCKECVGAKAKADHHKRNNGVERDTTTLCGSDGLLLSLSRMGGGGSGRITTRHDPLHV